MVGRGTFLASPCRWNKGLRTLITDAAEVFVMLVKAGSRHTAIQTTQFAPAHIERVNMMIGQANAKEVKWDIF